jgi:hypothetical protein
MRMAKCPADTAFGGGAAGAGKSFQLLLDTARNIRNPKYRAILFRRTNNELEMPGGLIERGNEIYMSLGRKARPKFARKRWTFPSGAKILCAHCYDDKALEGYMGSEFDFIGFDEIGNFPERYFTKLSSRARSVSGVRPTVRATLNPVEFGWTKDLVGPYIYPDDSPIDVRGLPIESMKDKVRFMANTANGLQTFENRQDAYDSLDEALKEVMSIDQLQTFSFVPGLISDNPILLENDPSYVGKMSLLTQGQRRMLLEGRWWASGDDSEMIVQRQAIEDAFTNSFIERGERFMTADIAHDGADRMVVVIWSGWRIMAVYVYDKGDSTVVRERLTMLMKAHGVPRSNFAFDAEGIGDYLVGDFRGAIPLKGGASPIEPRRAIKGAGKITSYDNLRAQMGYKLAEQINTRAIYLPADIIGDHNKSLRQELSLLRREAATTSGKLRLMKKVKMKQLLGRSPDILDTLMLRAGIDLHRKRYYRGPRDLA